MDRTMESLMVNYLEHCLESYLDSYLEHKRAYQKASQKDCQTEPKKAFQMGMQKVDRLVHSKASLKVLLMEQKLEYH